MGPEDILTRDAFEEYLGVGTTVALGLPAGRQGKIIVDPVGSSLSMHVPANEIPDLTLYSALRARLEPDGLGVSPTAVLEVLAGSRMYEAYLFFVNILSRFRGHVGFSNAVLQTLEDFSQLLDEKGVLTLEKQVGLLGELLFLEHLMRYVTPLDAMQKWLGPEGGEHDFTLSDFDVEIKTTTNEKRIHRITTLQQLEPVNSRPLFLASFQLTLSGSKSAFSLESKVQTISSSIGSLVPIFESKLERVGWNRDHSHFYSQKYEKRAPALMFGVNEKFPALFLRDLDLSSSVMPRISDLSYRLNLDGLEAILLEDWKVA